MNHFDDFKNPILFTIKNGAFRVQSIFAQISVLVIYYSTVPCVALLANLAN